MWTGEPHYALDEYELPEMPARLRRRADSRYTSGRCRDWLKFKNPAAPTVKREAEEEWGTKEKPLGLRQRRDDGPSTVPSPTRPQGGPLGNGRPYFCFAPVGPIVRSMPSKKPRPPKNPGRRRALILLASCPDGCTEAVMQAHGFTIEQIAELIRAGLAAAQTERVVAGTRRFEVTRVNITEVGQRELAGRRRAATTSADIGLGRFGLRAEAGRRVVHISPDRQRTREGPLGGSPGGP
jgi:hypothetical protein